MNEINGDDRLQIIKENIVYPWIIR